MKIGKMNPKKSYVRIAILSCLLLLFLSSNVSAQHYRDIFKSKFSISIDSARVFSEQLIQSNQLEERAFGLITKVYLIAKKGDFEVARKFYEEGLNEIEKIKNRTLKDQEKAHGLYYYSMYFLIQHRLKEAQP